MVMVEYIYGISNIRDSWYELDMRILYKGSHKNIDLVYYCFCSFGWTTSIMSLNQWTRSTCCSLHTHTITCWAQYTRWLLLRHNGLSVAPHCHWDWINIRMICSKRSLNHGWVRICNFKKKIVRFYRTAKYIYRVTLWLKTNSWLTALFGAIFPFEDKTQIQKSWRLKGCLRAVSEGL